MKKTICLVTNWYPTKENPHAGVFFKEQAFAVSDHFDFIVVHYREHLKKSPLNKNTVTMINKEQNTVEYDIDVFVPGSLYGYDLLYDFRRGHNDEQRIDGVGRYVSDKRSGFTRAAITGLFENEIGIIPDAFYCIDAQKDAFYIRCLAEHFQKPYIVGEHAPVPWPGTVIRDINKEAIEKADAFLAISNDKIRQLMLSNIHLPETHYIGNLIDEDKLVIRKKKENDIKTFIIVAAHSFYKNYDMFIMVMNRLSEITDKDFRVMIVGYASNKGYSKNVEAFEKQIRESRFADRAVMIPSVDHEEIGSVLNEADAFVMTSIQEGQPVSAMEAACCGLPIFSTRCGGVEDYIDDRMGRIYPVTDADNMAEDLKAYLEGKIEFDDRYIRESVVKRFGKSAFAENFCEAFNRVIKNG